MKKPKFIELTEFQEYTAEEMNQRATDFLNKIKKRRTGRDFSKKEIP